LGAVIRWQDAETLDVNANELARQPELGSLFTPVPTELSTSIRLKARVKDFTDYLNTDQVLNLYYSSVLKAYSKPGESERDFRIRAQQMTRELRDSEVEKLRQKYQLQLDRLQERLTHAQDGLAEDQAEYEARKREEIISAGETVASMIGIFGRRRPTTALSRAATKRRLTSSAKGDVERSQAEIARLQSEMDDIRRNMEKEANAVSNRWSTALDNIETYSVKPRRSDVQVDIVALGWAPYWELDCRSGGGRISRERVPAWRK
jgi:ElaB/YqjD/DUF883 family membrane-anchored ribosome-binding protein